MHGTIQRLLPSFASRWAVLVLTGVLGLALSAGPVLAQTSEMSTEEKKQLRQKLQQTFKQGAQAGQAGNYQTAAASFEEALRIARGNQEALNLGDNLIRKIQKNLVGSLKAAGSDAVSSENYAEALSLYDRVAEYADDDPAVHYNRGLAYLGMDSTDAGLQALDQAIQIGNETGNTRVAGRATERLRSEFLARASQALQGDNPSQEQIDTALSALDEMEEYIEPNANAMFYRATALFEDDQLEQAIQTARQGLEMHQGSRNDAAKFYYVIAESEMQLGNKAEACQTFENAAYGDYENRAEHYLQNECDDL